MVLAGYQQGVQGASRVPAAVARRVPASVNQEFFALLFRILHLFLFL